LSDHRCAADVNNAQALELVLDQLGVRLLAPASRATTSELPALHSIHIRHDPGSGDVVDIKRSTDHVAMPWANGRGTTLELAIHPDGATLSSMEWRISVATVAEPGAFSTLQGVDRVLLMLDDVESVLTVDGRDVPLRRLDQVEFSGDSDVSLASVSAPARDLNLMTRRGAWRGALTVIDLAQPQPAATADVSWLLVVTGSGYAVRRDRREAVEPLDLVRLEDGTLVTGTGEGVRIDLSRGPVGETPSS
jgi:environmental stress-induced protein Ves